MAELTFKYTDEVSDEENREVGEVTLSVPNDMTIQEYKVVCIRMASTLGYSSRTIKKGFGDIIKGNENADELSKLILEIQSK